MMADLKDQTLGGVCSWLACLTGDDGMDVPCPLQQTFFNTEIRVKHTLPRIRI